MFLIIVIFLYEISPIQWLLSLHCGYWWPSALVPWHRQPLCWIYTHAFPTVYGFKKFKIKKKTLLAFSTIYQHWYDVGYWNLFWWRARHVVNMIDTLAPGVVMASAAMLSTQLSWNFPVSVPQEEDPQLCTENMINLCHSRSACHSHLVDCRHLLVHPTVILTDDDDFRIAGHLRT